MPVYNGEKYLKRTFDSILSQTFTDFEVICVDDSSTDSSFEVLKEYANQDNRIKAFRKPNGGMVPKSWNYALPKISGEYILYMSQDDFISPDLLELLYNKALSSKADAVIPDLVYYQGEGHNNPIKSGLHGDKKIDLSGKEAFLSSLKWEIHAFVLWKAELVRRIGFDELATNSDEYATRNFFLNSNKVVFSNGTFYYGKENPEAITKKISIKRFNWCLTDRRLLELMKKNNFSKQELTAFNCEFWGNTMELHAILLRRGNQLSKEERERANNILKESYKAMDMDLIASAKGVKGKVIRQLFTNGFALICATVFVYSLFNKKI